MLCSRILFVALVFATATAEQYQSEEIDSSKGIRGGESEDSELYAAYKGGKDKNIEELCPPGEKFTTCGSACPPTCSNIHRNEACPNVCVVGCFCEEGMVRNHDRKCVKQSMC